ncbi:MAG: DUF2185 domain-containing protein [Clostridia bacterium]|nr:DUF2185 domain-containing protein [Clostridia bacterium]
MFFKKKQEIKRVINSKENLACLATNRITIDGEKVGYMYREKPDTSFPDSGWRFFAGDESDEYVNNPDNIKIYSLNTICNYDESIEPLLSSDYGVAYIKVNGVFIKENL